MDTGTVNAKDHLMTPKERLDKALSIFLLQNPNAQREIESLLPTAADDLGMGFNDYKKEHSLKLFGQYSRTVGLDIQLLIIQMTAESLEEQNSLKREHYREIAKALGMTWEEYLEHNPQLASLV